MSKKVVNLTERRRRKKPRTPDEIARAAARRFAEGGCGQEEPDGLASGSMGNLDGGNECEEEEKEDERDK